MYVCVCVYVCMRVCVCVSYVRLQTVICILAGMFLYVPICMDGCMYVCMHTYAVIIIIMLNTCTYVCTKHYSYVQWNLYYKALIFRILYKDTILCPSA